MTTHTRDILRSLIGFAQLVAGGLLGLLGHWLQHYRKGFHWKHLDATKFNFHPLFMVLGLVVLYGEGIMVYRLFRTTNKLAVKILHAVIQITALAFTVVGLCAVFSNHNDSKTPHIYTIHSWVGLATVILFGLQWLIGFMVYLIPVAPESMKAKFMDYHRYFGLTIFGMAIVATMMGLVEKVGFSVTEYSKRTKEAYIVNFFGVLVMVFGWLVTFITTKSEFKRPRQENDFTALN